MTHSEWLQLPPACSWLKSRSLAQTLSCASDPYILIPQTPRMSYGQNSPLLLTFPFLLFPCLGEWRCSCQKRTPELIQCHSLFIPPLSLLLSPSFPQPPGRTSARQLPIAPLPRRRGQQALVVFISVFLESVPFSSSLSPRLPP